MNKEFGVKLKEYRQAKNLTVGQLADQVGISGRLLLNIEEHSSQVRLSYPVIERISQVLDVEPESLINITWF